MDSRARVHPAESVTLGVHDAGVVLRLSDVSRRRAGKTSAVRARRTVCTRSTRGGGVGGKSGGGGGGKSGGVLCRRRGATEEIRGQDVLESRTYRRPCRQHVPAATLRPFLRPYALAIHRGRVFPLRKRGVHRHAALWPDVFLTCVFLRRRPPPTLSLARSPHRRPCCACTFRPFLTPSSSRRSPTPCPYIRARVFFLRSSLILIFSILAAVPFSFFSLSPFFPYHHRSPRHYHRRPCTHRGLSPFPFTPSSRALDTITLDERPLTICFAQTTYAQW